LVFVVLVLAMIGSSGLPAPAANGGAKVIR
jgi:hypothetical protein